MILKRTMVQPCTDSTTILHNTNRYLSEEVVQLCFESGRHSLVDKQVCGNGFTTAFLKIKPVKSKNIIIVPNRQVILEKQHQYKQGKKQINRIGFFYGEGDRYISDTLDYDKFDVFMFVADSFIAQLNKLVLWDIDKILIDEAHSILAQSSYRTLLKSFTNKVKDNFSTSSIVSVTATPLLFQRPDVKIINTQIKERTIYVTEHVVKTIDKAIKSLDNGKNVLVATNNTRIATKFAKKGVLRANFKTGKSFKQSLVELVKVEQDNDSNLTIISTSGFEGFDLSNGVNDVFIFEDRATDYNTYFVASIVQAIGRSREGTDSIFWCRNQHSKGRTAYDKERILTKLISKKISAEKKLTDKNYYDLRKFVVQSDSKLIKKGDFVLSFDNDAWNLYDETQRTDTYGLMPFTEFFKERGFTINYLNDGVKRLGAGKKSKKIKEKNIELNKGYIKEYKVYDGIYIPVMLFDTLKECQKHLDKYLRRKYWEVGNHTENYSERELTAWAILNDEEYFNIYCNKIIKLYKKSKADEVGKRSKEYKKKVTELESNIKSIVSRLILMLSNKKVKLPKKAIVWRDYNLLTEVSLAVIEELAKDFNISIKEFDIISCNPRIIYAICGLKLPVNFYGENKELKIPINRALNSLAYDGRSRTASGIKDQKQNKKKRLKQLGFDDKVIDFLISKFFNNTKDAVFNFCAYHEEMIISKLKKDLQLVNDNSNDTTFIRRHDSIIAFGEEVKGIDMINSFEYLDYKGWFVA